MIKIKYLGHHFAVIATFPTKVPDADIAVANLGSVKKFDSYEEAQISRRSEVKVQGLRAYSLART
jgi:hypothetical protein